MPCQRTATRERDDGASSQKARAAHGGGCLAQRRRNAGTGSGNDGGNTTTGGFPRREHAVGRQADLDEWFTNVPAVVHDERVTR